MMTFDDHVSEAAHAGKGAWIMCGSYECAIEEYLTDAGFFRGPERERVRDAAMKKCYFDLIALERDA